MRLIINPYINQNINPTRSPLANLFLPHDTHFKRLYPQIMNHKLLYLMTLSLAAIIGAIFGAHALWQMQTVTTALAMGISPIETSIFDAQNSSDTLFLLMGLTLVTFCVHIAAVSARHAFKVQTKSPQNQSTRLTFGSSIAIAATTSLPMTLVALSIGYVSSQYHMNELLAQHRLLQRYQSPPLELELQVVSPTAQASAPSASASARTLQPSLQSPQSPPRPPIIKALATGTIHDVSIGESGIQAMFSLQRISNMPTSSGSRPKNNQLIEGQLSLFLTPAQWHLMLRRAQLLGDMTAAQNDRQQQGHQHAQNNAKSNTKSNTQSTADIMGIQTILNQVWQLPLAIQTPHHNHHFFGPSFERLDFIDQRLGKAKLWGDDPQIDILPRNPFDLSQGFGMWMQQIKYRFWQQIEQAVVQHELLVDHTIDINTINQVMQALTIGEQSGISSQVWQAFQNTGVIHLISISGFHVTLLAALMTKFSGELWHRSSYLSRSLPKGIAQLWIGIAFSLFYALLTGWGVAAQRTAMMLTLWGVLSWLGVSRAGLRVWSIMVFAIIIFQPLSILTPGFLLSYLCIFSLIFVLNQHQILIQPYRYFGLRRGLMPLGCRVRSFSHQLLAFVLMQLMMGVILWPIEMFLFQSHSLVGVAINLVAIAFVSLWLMAFLGAYLLLIIFGSELPLHVLREVLGFGLDGLLSINPSFSNPLIWMGQWPTWFCICLLVAALLLFRRIAMMLMGFHLLWQLEVLERNGFLMEIEQMHECLTIHRQSQAMLGRYQRLSLALKKFTDLSVWMHAVRNGSLAFTRPLTLTLVLATLLFALYMTTKPKPTNTANDPPEVVFLDVGQGTAVLIKSPTQTWLYDTGRVYNSGDPNHNAISQALIPYLKAHQIRHLDGLILSHDDNDHTGGAAYLSEFLAIDLLVTNISSERLQELGIAAKSTMSCHEQWQWHSQDLHLQGLWPAKQSLLPHSDQDNTNSCVVMVDFPYADPSFRFLLTGDMDQWAEQQMRKLNHPHQLAADVLMVPHHGSNTSSSQSLLDVVQPQMAIVQAGAYNQFHHPTDVVWQRYLDQGIPILSSIERGDIRFRWLSDEPKKEWRVDTSRHSFFDTN